MKKKLEYVMGAAMIMIFLLSAIIMNVNARNEIKNSNNESSKQKKQDLSDVVVVVDAGHGGFDPGKVGINNELEKDINLSISIKLRDCLEKNGIKVIMTRTEDIGLYNENDTNKKRTDMNKRVELINESKAVVCVSIHQNSYTSKSVRGAQTFYYSKSEEGKRLAELIQQYIISEVDTSNKRMAKSNNNYYMLLHTDCPSVIVECGFLSNWNDATSLRDDNYQNKLVMAIYKALLEYLSNI